MDTSERPRLVGYLRCSTREQAASGLGLEGQRAAIEAAAGDRWTLAEIVCDEQSSGRNLDRDGIRDALTRIAAGDFDGLVCSRLDRLARSVLDFMELVEWFRAVGAVLVVLDPPIDTTTATGELNAGFLAQIAQWERKIIAERTTAALAARRARGDQISRDAVPADIAARIRAERDGGSTWQSIADRLNADGTPTVRGGALWRVSAVQTAGGLKRGPKPYKRPDLPAIPRGRRARRSA